MKGLLLCSLMVAQLLGALWRADAEDILEVTDATFRRAVLEVVSDKPTLVFFRAPWCGPCRMMLPQLVEFARDEKLKLVAVDIDQNSETAKKYGVTSIPLTIGIRNGSPSGSVVGAAGKEKFHGLLK